MPNLLVTATTRYDPKGLNKAKKHISSFNKTIKDLGKTFSSVFAAQKVLAYGKSSVQAFVADDKAAKVLSRTLGNLGLAFADPAIKTFISDLEKQFGVLDDYLRPAYQKLITTTGDYGKSQDLLRTALDLSAQSGENIVSVTSDIARAYAGNTKGLQKYGLGLTKAQLSAMSFEEILLRITKISKGQAALAADTYSGKLDKLDVAAKNASETIGGALVDAFVTLAGNGNIDSATSKIDTFSQALATLISPSRMNALFAGVDFKFGFIPINKPIAARGPAQQSPGERAAAVAYNKKLAAEKKAELAILAAKNKATKEEAQMKKDQAALDALKAKFDLERIGLNAALVNATDEETKARIRAQIAILDETGKTAQSANDALVKAQAQKLEAELKAGAALEYLATSAGMAAIGITKWLSLTEKMKETTGNAGGGVLIGVAATKVVTPANNTGLLGSTGAGGATDSQNTARLVAASISAASANAGLNLGVGADAKYDQMLAEMATLAKAVADAAKLKPEIIVTTDPTVLVQVVQDAVITNSRFGNLSTQPGALAAV